MTFKETLTLSDTDNVLDILKGQYGCSDNDLQGYRKLNAALLLKAPIQTDCQIVIEHVCEGGEEYEHICGRVKGEEQTCGIEFAPRAEWLGMEVSAETLENYSTDEIVAHCLWEMTFFGFSEKEMNSMKEKLMDSLDEDECVEYKDGELLGI